MQDENKQSAKHIKKMYARTNGYRCPLVGFECNYNLVCPLNLFKDNKLN